MAGPSYAIRPARLPDDAEAFEAFIHGSQVYEAAFEPNRRLDDQVDRDHLGELTRKVAERDGRIFVAETVSGALLGWVVSFPTDDEIFVVESERRVGYIAELFVVAEERGKGIGAALVAAAEADFRARGLAIAMIGVLPGNRRALAAYQEWGYSPYAIELRKRL
jgi:GNAT superfamily N-acetyltransferase